MSDSFDYSYVITNFIEILSRFEPCDQFSWGKESKPNYRRIYAFLARVLRGDTAAATCDLTAADAVVLLAQLDRISTKLSSLSETNATKKQEAFLAKFDASAQPADDDESTPKKDNTFCLNPLAIPIPLLALDADDSSQSETANSSEAS